MKIDCFTFLGANSTAYAEYLKYTCEKFLSGKHDINWKCIQSVGSNSIPKGYKCVAKTGDVGHNSMNHGIAMNKALEYIESDYVLFIDADMAVVYPNWDSVMVNELNTYDCFGGAYGEKIKYKNFPTVYFFSFRSYILDKVKLDFTPSVKPGVDKPKRIVLNEKKAKLCNMKPGEVLKCDTGWRLPIIIRGAGFTGNSMPMVMMYSKNAQLPFEDERHKKLCMKKRNHMYEWLYKGKVFATHKQASRTQPLNEKWGQAWKRRIDLYIKQRGK